jgi:hypothetical protein
MAPTTTLELKTQPGFEKVWGWVFDFCNTYQFWVFEYFQNQRTDWFRYLKKSDSKLVLAISKTLKNYWVS